MMESISVLNESGLMDSKIANTLSCGKQFSIERAGSNPVFDSLIAEGGENFFNYLHCFGLGQESNLLVLSSRHHYYYDHNDLKGVKVLVNLKRLNLIKHLDSFLHVIYRVLPPKANFIGCFSDSRNNKRNGSPFFHTRLFYQKFINFLDSRTDRNLNKNEVIEILNSHGFKVVDMSEINGQTYFRTQNRRRSGE